MDAPRPELYDVARDPGERTDRRAAEPSRAAAMAEALARLRPRPVPSGPTVAPEAAERLRALGYTGAGASPPPDQPPSGLADPKDRVGGMERALGSGGAAGGRAPRGGGGAVRCAARPDPANRFALARSGQALVALGRAAAGIARLQQRGRGRAGPPGVAARARASLARRGPRAGGRGRQCTALTRLQPREPSHWVGLGNALGQAGQRAARCRRSHARPRCARATRTARPPRVRRVRGGEDRRSRGAPERGGARSRPTPSRTPARSASCWRGWARPGRTRLARRGAGPARPTTPRRASSSRGCDAVPPTPALDAARRAAPRRAAAAPRPCGPAPRPIPALGSARCADDRR